MTSNTASNHQEGCRCVGGPLHRDELQPFGESAGLLYRLSHDFPGEPARQAIYERRPLTRATDAGPDTRDFLVLMSVTDQDGKQVDAGLSDDQALALTLAAPALFWK
ncbi:hypothetical protein KTD19_28540 [Burkholderia multivorans]|uniref:Uncharacterized protein n=1 Tax=Burkholderia multivorans TaxID=87883 RepID=A0AB37B274_9BURK|nr:MULTISPECIES: hypothetical protein [Burkholderia cepacia complex]ARF90394.1 uncharacterized protein BCN122_III0363 [Burkholderia cenocepacia]MBJ9625251.1 hypothetical protein [Burkholderia multivorans]MBU9212345.1 hypothetical protein [Burkholderia multivorans]MBU9236326.1 hypothetical protein [Burkholderia multivorans]MBU9336825.1 hypothetical protein [Burkholderia multivorans]